MKECDMNKLFVNRVCAFVPIKSFRQNVRTFFKIKNKKKTITPWKMLKENNYIEIAEEDKKFVHLTIKGINNKVIIKKLSPNIGGSTNISLVGDNCTEIEFINSFFYVESI